METKGKLTNDLEKDVLKSLDECDVKQLRSKLKEIQVSAENELQSYNMISTDSLDIKW
jgi:hypothetical protein